MTATSIDVAKGIWAAWMLGLPLVINGRDVYIPDEVGAALFHEQPDDDRPPTQDYTAPHVQRDLARHCAWFMAIAAREITALGVDVGALATHKFAEATRVYPRGAAFEAAPHTLAPSV